MLTIASAPPGITFDRKPPSTMVFVNVVRMSELSSGPKSLRRITRRPSRSIARLPRARARRRRSAAWRPSAASASARKYVRVRPESRGRLRWRPTRASARASRSIALGGSGREECVETPRVRSTTESEILSRTVTAARST